jgi:hypothetical protein
MRALSRRLFHQARRAQIGGRGQPGDGRERSFDGFLMDPCKQRIGEAVARINPGVVLSPADAESEFATLVATASSRI